jgi:rare lipoprotein A
MLSAPSSALRVSAAALLLASLAACGSTSTPSPGQGANNSRGAYKVGNPYRIDGVTYVPNEEFNRTETGVASWYGPGFHGKATANGERYDQHDYTAAHRTLQMPSMVRVTNLDNGRSVVVRVNDRGPYASNRVIDLSRAAANDLDMVRAGTARIRIDQLAAESQAVKEVAIGGGGPNDQKQEVERLAKRGPAAPTPTTMVAAAPAPAPLPPPVAVYQPPPPQAIPFGPPTAAPPPSIPSLVSAAAPASGFYVQTGAFSSVANAERQRGLITSYGTSEVSQGSAAGREVYRVRIGPYTSADAAGIVADRLKRSGYGEARVVVAD